MLDQFGRIYESEAKLMTLFAVEENGRFNSRIRDMMRMVELQVSE